MQPIVILLLVILQLVVQSIVSDAGVFLSRRKLRVCIRIPVATIYDAQHREILVSRNSGTRKKNDRGGGEEFSAFLLARLDSPQLFDVFLTGGYASRRFGQSKEPHENVNFDLFLYSVQPQLPSTGESSYSINMSGGHASIGDHSVTNVGTATPR